MKNIFTYWVLLLFFTSSTSFAQKRDTVFSKKVSFSINPLQLAFGEARASMEIPFTKKQAGEITVGFIYSNLNSNSYISSNNDNFLLNGTIGGKAGFGYKYYFKKGEERGSYFNPLLFYKFLDYTNFRLNSTTPLDVDVKTNAIYYQIISLQLQYGFYSPWQGNGILVNYYFGIGIRYKYGIALQESTKPEVIISSHRILESSFYPSINIGVNFKIDS
jgi:hypothetical protein